MYSKTPAVLLGPELLLGVLLSGSTDNQQQYIPSHSRNYHPVLHALRGTTYQLEDETYQRVVMGHLQDGCRTGGLEPTLDHRAQQTAVLGDPLYPK